MPHLARKQLCIIFGSLRVLHYPEYHQNAAFVEKTTLHYFRLFASATQSCIAPECCIWRENNFALFLALCGCYTFLHSTKMLHSTRKKLCTILDPLRVLYRPA